jgi:hypothetical protein
MYFSQSTVWAIKPRSMRWARHLKCMEEVISMYSILNVSLKSFSSQCFVCIYYLSYASYVPRPSLLFFFFHFITLKLYLVNNRSIKRKATFYAVFFILLLAYFPPELNILLSTRFSNTLLRIISLG